MTVDGQESPMVTTAGDATTLDVEGKLYLGGLPSEYRARNIGNVSSIFSLGPFCLYCGCVCFVEEYVYV